MCRRSRRRGTYERTLSLLGLFPWRCQTCEARFFAGLVPPKFFTYVHCPNCGNLDVEHVRRERVVGGVWTTIKRVMKFPAYRCDACRTRFFSLRRYRPIEPTAWPDFTAPLQTEVAAAAAGTESADEAADPPAPSQLDDATRNGLS